MSWREKEAQWTRLDRQVYRFLSCLGTQSDDMEEVHSTQTEKVRLTLFTCMWGGIGRMA